MTKTLKKINTFINELDKKYFRNKVFNCLSHFLTDNFLEELDQDDPEECYNEIYDKLNENGFFNIKVICYSKAIKYLQEEDQSLQESIALASEYGCKLEDIDSKLLANLLASEAAKDVFRFLEYEITEFFND